jgi:hypothetical protein
VSTLLDLWNWIVNHRADLLIALIFALIVDLLAIRSRVRSVIRHVENRLSERSAKRLRERIKQLERQRDSYVMYLASDKALYLATFRVVIGILIFMIIGAEVHVLSEMVSDRPTYLLSLGSYAIALLVAIQGLKVSSLDTRAKVEEVISKLESETADLKTKLHAMAR